MIVEPAPTVADALAPVPATRRSGARMRIFNVKYSPNLGDGLLSECLEQALTDSGTAPDTWSVDLAGRGAYAQGSQARGAQMRALRALPGPLRNLAVRVPLAVQSHRCWGPHYRQALAGAECVVIGGGNLLADLDLNFPTKIALVTRECALRRLPVFIYGCGASEDWSRRGRALLECALGHGVIRRVFLRDDRSCRIWNALAGTEWGLEATPVRDPGLLAADRYAIPPQAQRPGGRRVGINITSQLALRYHAADAPSRSELDAWYLDLARALIDRGQRIAVFTNGSPEDRAEARRLRPALQALSTPGTVSFPKADSPQDLTRLIASLGAIAAFRMHAVIAAYACGVPFLALRWDPKLDAFVASVDRCSWLCHPRQMSGATAAGLLLDAMRQGIPEDERERVVGEARRGVATLQDAIAWELGRG